MTCAIQQDLFKKDRVEILEGQIRSLQIQIEIMHREYRSQFNEIGKLIIRMEKKKNGRN